MSDYSTKRQKAKEACDKAINGIEDGTISDSSVLLLCKKIARLLNDTEGMEWLEYESSGYPKDENGHILHEAWKIGVAHGRSYKFTDKTGKTREAIFTELSGELESIVQGDKAALNNYSTQGFSVSGDHAAIATNNLTHAVARGTGILLNDIKTAERRLEILKSQYYNYALKWQIELSFGNVSKTIYDEYCEIVDNYYTKLPTTIINKLSAVEDLMEDGNPERYAQVLTSCRRLWSEVAKHLFNELFPNYKSGTFKTVSGKEIDISGDHDNNKLSA